MPCYSTVQTKLTDLAAARKAAEDLGYEVRQVSATQIIVNDQKTGHGVRLVQYPGEKTLTASYSTGNVLAKVTERYAVNKVKQFAQKRGYLVSRGTKPGEYVLTSYR